VAGQEGVRRAVGPLGGIRTAGRLKRPENVQGVIDLDDQPLEHAP
jgi:hypothetical protein